MRSRATSAACQYSNTRPRSRIGVVSQATTVRAATISAASSRPAPPTSTASSAPEPSSCTRLRTRPTRRARSPAAWISFSPRLSSLRRSRDSLPWAWTEGTACIISVTKRASWPRRLRSRRLASARGPASRAAPNPPTTTRPAAIAPSSASIQASTATAATSSGRATSNCARPRLTQVFIACRSPTKRTNAPPLGLPASVRDGTPRRWSNSRRRSPCTKTWPSSSASTRSRPRSHAPASAALTRTASVIPLAPPPTTAFAPSARATVQAACPSAFAISAAKRAGAARAAARTSRARLSACDGIAQFRAAMLAGEQRAGDVAVGQAVEADHRRLHQVGGLAHGQRRGRQQTGDGNDVVTALAQPLHARPGAHCVLGTEHHAVDRPTQPVGAEQRCGLGLDQAVGHFDHGHVDAAAAEFRHQGLVDAPDGGFSHTVGGYVTGVGEIEYRSGAGVFHQEVVVAGTRAGDLRGAHAQARPGQPAHQMGARRGLAGVHGGAGHDDHARRRLAAGTRRQRVAAQVERIAVLVGQDAQRLDLGGPAVDALMPVDGLGGDAAGGHQVAMADGPRHVGLELLGRIAVAVADDDLVAVEQLR